MVDLEKEKFINNFDTYIEQGNMEKIYADLISNVDLCALIVEKDLYWKNFYRIKEDEIRLCASMFKIIYKKDLTKTFFNKKILARIDYNETTQFLYDYIFAFLINVNHNSDELEEIFEYLIKNKTSFLTSKFINCLFQSNYKYIVENNFYCILNSYNDVFELKEIIRQDDQLLNKFNCYVNNNPNKLIYNIIKYGFILDLEEINKEKIFDTIKTIIYELLSNEEKQYSDIEYLGQGGTSFVVSIGDKVLKLGQQRKYFKIDNNKRFLKPLLRTEIKKVDSEEILGCVEITERVDTNNITEKDVYELYKELRTEGYYWGDCKVQNVGRLIKRNQIYFSDLNPTMGAVNYKNYCSEELQAGELVILDNDYIISENEFSKLDESRKKEILEMIDIYEKSYQEELKEKAVKI